MSLHSSPARDGNIVHGATPEKLLTEREAEEILGMARGWLAKDRIGKARIPHVKVGRSVRYQPSEIRAFIAASQRRSTSDMGQRVAA